MTPLGRGLASLIPRREPQEADDMLAQIDSVEEFEGQEPKIVTELKEREAARTEEKAEVNKVEVEATVRAARPKRLDVVEEEEADVMEAETENENEEEGDDIFAEIEQDEIDEEEQEELKEDDELSHVDDDVLEFEVIDEEDEDEEEPEEESSEEVEEDESDEEDEDDSDWNNDESEDVEEEKENVREEMVAEMKEGAFTSEPEDGVKHLLGEKVEYIPVGNIAVNPLQPRYRFDDHELEDLKRSIDQHGLLQPLVVNVRDDGSYQLVAGERRLRAVKQLGWREVPCVIRSDIAGDRNRLELALIENVQRSNLNPIEEAMGYQRLNEEYGMTHEEIGERVGRSRVGITNIIRVLQLPAEIQRGLIEGKISIGHARAILMIPDEEKQIRFYHHVVDEGLTVRKAENRARRIQRTMKLNDPLRQKTRGRAPLAVKYDGPLQDKFGYNARIKFDTTKNRYEIVFHAFSENEAEDLISKLLSGQGLPEELDEDVIEG